MYYIYILRCIDNSLYTGSTSDIKKRLKEHFSKNSLAAKYTKSHTPKEIVALWECEDKSGAMKVEYHIKTLTKAQKEELISYDKAPRRIIEKLQGIVLKRLKCQDLTNIVDFL